MSLSDDAEQLKECWKVDGWMWAKHMADNDMGLCEVFGVEKKVIYCYCSMRKDSQDNKSITK